MYKLEEQIAEAKETLADVDHALDSVNVVQAEDRRRYVLQYMADTEAPVEALISRMAVVERWLKTGELPQKDDKKVRHLRAVSSD